MIVVKYKFLCKIKYFAGTKNCKIAFNLNNKYYFWPHRNIDSFIILKDHGFYKFGLSANYNRGRY